MNDDFNADERAQRLVEWVDRAHAACEKGGQDAVAPLIDELDKCMVLHGPVVRRVDDKRHVTEYLDKRDSEVRDLRERLDRANHLLSTVGMDPQ